MDDLNIISRIYLITCSKIDNRKILLLVDNFFIDQKTIEDSKNIELFPHTQHNIKDSDCDVKIIQSFKMHY
jgi:hypothetical protein